MSKFSALLLTAMMTTSAGWSMTVNAEVDGKDGTVQSPETLIESQLKKLDASIPIESISKSPMPGIYQVMLKGGFVLYSSENGQFFIKGDLMEVRGTQLVNLTEAIKSQQNARLLKFLKKESMVIFAPKGETKGVVYAFTDVDCGYCRKLHREVNQLNELGIELRYLAFPRGGQQSPVHGKMTDAWCSVDRKQALTDLKTGKPVSVDSKGDKAACSAVIDEHYNLGIQMGINGTPAMVLENGQVIPGYRPAADIARIIESQS
ncbi:thioredoxin fold domain-containing protein [Endozoicomonas sp. SCSIO W0465]|uniref:thioredoxin fold domain-containing protein n=1 Tax=Endozoicomonas sp. SCSIO W0465 TaxID=2918516 RepID=UPI002075417A|nr:thioredoxin fold domain-containing protein [Endozoicomonas sp. SCSIO W0465]USE34347.1 thioredoxin fold domain-containing protein [Endozoicomonas sp. SCSIO W0465]